MQLFLLRITSLHLQPIRQDPEPREDFLRLLPRPGFLLHLSPLCFSSGIPVAGGGGGHILCQTRGRHSVNSLLKEREECGMLSTEHPHVPWLLALPQTDYLTPEAVWLEKEQKILLHLSRNI